MEYINRLPVTKRARGLRRRAQRQIDDTKQEKNRRKSIGGGVRPNQIGVTQGQNGEQGNSTEPRNIQR